MKTKSKGKAKSKAPITIKRRKRPVKPDNTLQPADKKLTVLLKNAPRCYGNITTLARLSGLTYGETQDIVCIQHFDLFKRTMLLGREQLLDVAEEKLLEKVLSGSTKTIIHTLSTLGRDRGYGTVLKIEDVTPVKPSLSITVTPAKANSLADKIIDVTPLPPEELNQ